MFSQSNYELLDHDWMFNIVRNLVYKDLLSKEFITNVERHNFAVTLYLNDLVFKIDNEYYDVNKDEKNYFIFFNRAYEFLSDLNKVDNLMELPKKYKVYDAFYTLHADGKTFKDPFYEYLYHQYLFQKTKLIDKLILNLK